MGTSITALHVRRSIFIQASPARVWQELESLERISAWLGIGQRLHRFEPRLMGSVDMSVEIGGAPRHYGGRVLSFEPDRELTLEVNWEAPHAWPVPTFWTIRLTPLYEGSLVELFHHGFERLGPLAADNLQAYEEGWSVEHLKALRALAEA